MPKEGNENLVLSAGGLVMDSLVFLHANNSEVQIKFNLERLILKSNLSLFHLSDCAKTQLKGVLVPSLLCSEANSEETVQLRLLQSFTLQTKRV